MKRLRQSEPALLFKTLADPTRLRLLNLLACGETCVCELADTLRVVQPKVSRHLARLKRARLVNARRSGKWTHYRWSQHGDPLVQRVLEGLRQWMAKDDAMNGERHRRRKVCRRISGRKPKRN
jgi:ArsR family transcriptional regulator, arsenate/arsenite/antimonite-responsive transcriptional repressor